MKRVLVTAIAVFALLYFVLCAGFYFSQRSLLYHPTGPSAAAADATVVVLPVDAAKLRLLAYNRQQPKAVIYFGGNAEDVGYRAGDLKQAFPGHALYLLYYRGYGGSTGEPSEHALVADGVALFDWVRKQHPHVQVVGRSLGTGVAVQVASQRNVERLVLVTPYDSIAEVANVHYGYFPVRWLVQDKFESWRFAPKVAAPTTIIAASDDTVIPPEHTRKLFARFAPGRAILHTVKGVDHQTIVENAEYLEFLGGR